jgi:hypothetical protein
MTGTLFGLSIVSRGICAPATDGATYRLLNLYSKAPIVGDDFRLAFL